MVLMVLSLHLIAMQGKRCWKRRGSDGSLPPVIAMVSDADVEEWMIASISFQSKSAKIRARVKLKAITSLSRVYFFTRSV